MELIFPLEEVRFQVPIIMMMCQQVFAPQPGVVSLVRREMRRITLFRAINKLNYHSTSLTGSCIRSRCTYFQVRLPDQPHI